MQRLLTNRCRRTAECRVVHPKPIAFERHPREALLALPLCGLATLRVTRHCFYSRHLTQPLRLPVLTRLPTISGSNNDGFLSRRFPRPTNEPLEASIFLCRSTEVRVRKRMKDIVEENRDRVRDLQ